MESNTNEESIENFSELTYRQRFAITEYGYLLSPENAEVVGKMLGNFQEKDVLPFCQAHGKKVSRSQEITPNKQLPIKQTKWRDIAIGFFGWIIFNNLYFLILFGSLIGEPGRITLFLGLPTIVVPIIFFLKKRNWIGVGILTAIFINMSIWTVLFWGGLPTLEVLPIMLFVPLPLGTFLFMN